MKNPLYTNATYRLVQDMKATGNRPGIIAQWKEQIHLWAHSDWCVGPDTEALQAFLPLWQARPFYTAKELAPIFPALALWKGFAERLTAVKSPKRLANELRFYGLPAFQVCLGEYKGPESLTTYFCVERIHYWRDLGTVAEFDKEFSDVFA